MNACGVSVLIGRDTTGMTCLKNFRSMSGFSGGAGAEEVHLLSPRCRALPRRRIAAG